MSIRRGSLRSIRVLLAFCFVFAVHRPAVCAQETQQKPAEKSIEKADAPAAPEFPAQLSLLETHVRFEANGDSRKEVHTIVKINNELGVRQFARLNFDYNRAFEQIEIPQVRITHASGGTADILPSAITDNPNPAVVNYPAYHDVRVKSVRILGLAPGDTLEYRVITNVSHHPLAPDFWFDHTFDRSGVVAHEIFELDFPASSQATLKINPQTPPTPSPPQEQADNTRMTYRWNRNQSTGAESSEHPDASIADLSLTTFKSWDQLASRLAALLIPTLEEGTDARKKAFTIPDFGIVDGEMQAVYDFVSKKIRTVDIPLAATGYKRRKPMEIFDSGYGSPEDKFVLFAAMLGSAEAGFVPESARAIADEPASPTLFSHLLTGRYQVGGYHWLDLNVEVAPWGMIPPQFRDRPRFVVERDAKPHWETASIPLRYRSSQMVQVNASLDADGKLTAKVKYTMRGDNELLLRVAFHQAPKEKWNDVAQLLSLSDGFRGKIISATASDPYDTKEPFTVEYEIEQQKFVDWSKKPIRIPAILPLLALPDPPAKPAPGAASSPIDLGTPLDVQTKVTLDLPPGTSARTPTGISVARDYATFSSQYSAKGSTLTASRHINFLLREVPAARAADYNAFVRAVQNDQTQLFVIEPAASK